MTERASSDVVKAVYDAFRRDDVGAALDLVHSDCIWVESEVEGMPVGGVHRGPDEVSKGVFEKVPQSFKEFELVSDDFIESGPKVVVTGRVKAVTLAGRKLDAPFAHVWTVRNGQVVHLLNFHDTALWLQVLEANSNDPG